jgi:hypothetical protein
MIALPKRLYPLYMDIKKLPIVQQKNVTNETLQELTEHLNRSVPTDESESKLKTMIVNMFIEKIIDIRTLETTQHCELFLYAPASILCNHLRLSEHVFIKFDRDSQTFSCALNFRKVKHIQPETKAPTITINNSFSAINEDYTKQLKDMLKISPANSSKSPQPSPPAKSPSAQSWADMDDNDDDV